MMTDWFNLPFFRDGHHYGILDDLYENARYYDEEEGEHTVPDYYYLPGEADLYRALKLTPPHKVKVVILGQDPYPTPGHANGLAFSVNRGITLPRSLQNIYRELKDDLNIEPPTHGDLTDWAQQGVLLLNTCFTVAPMQPGSHIGKYGWENLTAQILEHLADKAGIAFILWGRHAQSFEKQINTSNNLVIKTPHPSPLSAHYGFFGSKPFSRVNAFLKQPVNWGSISGPGDS